MRSTISTQLMPAEWRWLILMSSILVLVAFAPLLWIAIQGTGDYQFMGMLLNYQDAGSYLSKMELGVRGAWFVTFQHTPETHNGAFIQVLYPAIGQLAQLTGMPTLVLFHVARLGASLFMYIALYQLGAAIWTKVRSRKLFFGIAVLGAGFGWLLSSTMASTEFPDLTLQEGFPFLSTLMNVHFPLTIALLSLLVAILIAALRPGAELDPNNERALPLTTGISFALALLYPQALVPIGGTLAAYVAIAAAQNKQLPTRHVRWLLAIGLPALPLMVYYALIVNYNPAMAQWNAQNVTTSPPIHIFLLGLGIPLLIALPGIYRAVRRFELDGDRLFLLWLLLMIVAMYLPTNIQRRFGVGLMIPIAYFATRAIEDVWLRYVTRRRRAIVFTVVFSLMPISLLFVLVAPLLLFNMSPQSAGGIMLERDYVSAFAYLREETTPQDVILAAPNVSAWLPGYTGARVVFGHDYETLDADAKLAQVQAWYSEGADCQTLLDDYSVRYVLVGPQELQLGGADCAAGLTQVAQTGAVTIYAP
jgi:hypothetical protein